MLLDNGVMSSDQEEYVINLAFAVRSIGIAGLLNFIGLASSELSFSCCTSYEVLAPKRVIQENLIFNKQDLVA